MLIIDIYIDNNDYLKSKGIPKPLNNALDYATELLNLSNENNDLEIKCQALAAIGFIYLHKGKVERAEYHFDRAFMIIEDLNDDEIKLELRLEMLSQYIGANYYDNREKYAYALDQCRSYLWESREINCKECEEKSLELIESIKNKMEKLND